MSHDLTERSTSTARLVTEATTGSRYRVRLIEGPRWGSSGYYTSEALDSAPAAFEGAKTYLDHPTQTDERERPERSLRDLVGAITNVTRESDGVWGHLQVRPHMAELVESLASSGDLDMSIRATAEAAPGQVNGRAGLIVSRFVDGLSVDLVTEAGAGGRVYDLLESARARLTEAPTRDRRDQLQRALNAAYGDPERDRYPWLADFDDVTRVCWYEDGRETWQQPYSVAADDLSAVLTGERIEVRPVTQYHPVTSAGPVGESPIHHTKEKHMEITEARFAELTAAADRVTALEAERDSAVQRAEAAEAEARTVAREAYHSQIAAAVAASGLPAPACGRVTESLMLLGEADAVPASPTAVIESAIKAERDYVTSLAPSLAGGPSRRLGFGGGADPVTESYTNPWGRIINPVKEA